MKVKMGAYIGGLELEVPEEYIKEAESLNKEWHDTVEHIKLNNEQMKEAGDKVQERMNREFPDNKENWFLPENKEKRSYWWGETNVVVLPHMDKHMELVNKTGEISKRITEFVEKCQVIH